MKKKSKIVVRVFPSNSINGQFCTKKFALDNPNITTIEHRKIKIKKK